MSNNEMQAKNKLPFTDAYALGEPELKASFKSTPEDFVVVENLGFDLQGSGEHIFVFVEKRNLNTVEVQRILAKHCQIALRDSSYSGLKDKFAVTQQWFSFPGGEKTQELLEVFQHDEIRLLKIEANGRKLRRGVHKNNSFKIVLRNVKGEQSNFQERVNQINEQGVPNYFGPQRFGFNGDNLEKARALFAGQLKERNRMRRGLYLSAARSYLFNSVLSARVQDSNWDTLLDGEVLALSGSASSFVMDLERDEKSVLEERLRNFDIHPTGPLWGEGELRSFASVAERERSLSEEFSDLCEGLERYGLKQERRSLRLEVKELSVSFDSDEVLTLAFSLPKGTYATTVLRELVSL